MFAKLLKHEWKATSKLLGILSLCILGAGLLGAAALRAIDYCTSKAVNDGMAVLLIAGFGFLLLGLVMALVAYGVGTGFYLVYRFYKTRFTDQGYLTFTLPVSNRSILLSAYVNMLLWSLISGLTISVAVATALLLGGVATFEDLFQEIAYTFFSNEGPDGYAILQFAGFLISSAAGTMITMASITVGAVIAKKHKILAAIGIYYGQSLVMGILAGVIQMAAAFALYATDASEANFLLTSSLTYVLQAAWGVGAYILSMHLINKKLNLP